MSNHEEFSWQPSCPFCGASEDPARALAWRCGSRLVLHGEVWRGAICDELCHLRAFKQTVLANIKRVRVDNYAWDDPGRTLYCVDIGHPMIHSDAKESFLAAMDRKINNRTY